MPPNRGGVQVFVRDRVPPPQEDEHSVQLLHSDNTACTGVGATVQFSPVYPDSGKHMQAPVPRKHRPNDPQSFDAHKLLASVHTPTRARTPRQRKKAIHGETGAGLRSRARRGGRLGGPQRPHENNHPRCGSGSAGSVEAQNHLPANIRLITPRLDTTVPTRPCVIQPASEPGQGGRGGGAQRAHTSRRSQKQALRDAAGCHCHEQVAAGRRASLMQHLQRHMNKNELPPPPGTRA